MNTVNQNSHPSRFNLITTRDIYDKKVQFRIDESSTWNNKNDNGECIKIIYGISLQLITLLPISYLILQSLWHILLPKLNYLDFDLDDLDLEIINALKNKF